MTTNISISVEAIAQTATGFVYDLHCEVEGDQNITAITYFRIEYSEYSHQPQIGQKGEEPISTLPQNTEWAKFHTKHVSGSESYTFRRTFPKSMFMDRVFVMLDADGTVSDIVMFTIGTGLTAVHVKPTPEELRAAGFPFPPDQPGDATDEHPAGQPPSGVYNFTRLHGLVFAPFPTLTLWSFKIRDRFIGSFVHEILHPLI